MGWGSAVKTPEAQPVKQRIHITPRTPIETATIDWDRLVALDMETYYDTEYTLRKLNTSEYVRDERFKALMVGVKVGKKKTVVIPHEKIKAYLKTIDWSTHSLLCHHAAFDGFILSHHYGIVPKYYYCTLSMAKGLHSNEIGAGLDEVAKFYGGRGKIEGVLEDMKGIRDLPPALYKKAAEYCGQDVDEMLRIFKEMVKVMPSNEMRLINLTVALFADPKLKIDLPRVQAEYEREKDYKENLLISFLGTPKQVEKLLKADITEFQRQVKGEWQFRKKDLDDLKMRAEDVTVRDMLLLQAKRKISSSEQFADILRAEGVEPPVKISPTWIKKRPNERTDEGKWTYAFAKDDLDFIALRDVSQKLSDLVDLRLAVKSTQGLTRAERFLKAGMNGWPLPVYLHYYGAHTGRWCMKPETEVLTRRGWIRMDQWRDEAILQWAPDRSLTWCSTTQMNVFNFDGELVRTDAHHIRGAYTPEHCIPAWTTSRAFKTHLAGEAKGKNIRVPVNGFIDNGDYRFSGSDNLLRLIVAVQADGHIEDKERRPLRFKFRKVRKMERLRQLCQEENIPLSEYDTQPERTFSIARKDVPELLWAAKTFGSWMLQMSRHQIEVMLSELRYWDGSVNSDHTHYCTTVKQNAEMVATLAALVGKAASIHEDVREAPQSNKYTVTIRDREYAHVSSHKWGTEQYTGKVYCPTVETGFFLVRSEGKIFVTGNSAGNKMNLQNLERGGELRKSILAPPGYLIAVNDSGQIEARVNAWISEQDDLLDSFRAADRFEAIQSKLPKDQRKIATGEERDAYCKFADTIYGREITKKDEMERFVGKVGVLGLGYSMGAPKLQMTLAKGALGGPPVFFELDMCQKIVQAYRRKNHKIAAFWKLCSRIIEDMAAGREGSYKCLHWEKEKIWLPNGMCLKYPGLKCENDGEWDEWSYTRKEQRIKIYGGLLCENIVQALARIIIGEQMLMIAEKYRVVMTTHDEVSAIVKKAQAKSAFTFMQKCMATAPSWCADLPLNSEGKVEFYYAK